MTIGQLSRVVVQGAYFVLIARSLGPDQYGLFVGVVAIVAVAAPFATLGAGNVLIRRVSLDPSQFSLTLGNALVITLASSGVLVGLTCLISVRTLPGAGVASIVALVAVSDLLLARLIDLAGQAYCALERLDRTAQLLVLPAVTRLAGAALLSAVNSKGTAASWARLYAACSLAAVGVTALAVRYELTRPSVARNEIGATVREGSYFSVALASQTVYNDIDKTMLARLASTAATGVYGAAYRVIDMAFAPIRALLASTYTSYFRAGAEGLSSSVRLSRKLLPAMVAYGLISGALLFLLAPLLPAVLGQDFRGVVSATRWLALLPAIRAVHYLAADALTGAGLQRARTRIQILVAAANVCINFWLIPAYGWQGAAISSLFTDGLLAALLWLKVWHNLAVSQANSR